MPGTYFDYFAPDKSAQPVAGGGVAPISGAPNPRSGFGPFAAGGHGDDGSGNQHPTPPPPPVPTTTPATTPPVPPPPVPTGTGNTFDPAWLNSNIDSNISPDQWTAWKGFWDAAQAKIDPKHPFKSENVDQFGQPIQGFFEKPVDCPVGTTKYGVKQCLPLDNPKVLGVKPGAPAPGAPSPTAGTAGFDMQSFLSQILPLLLGFYGPQSAQGSFLPGTQTRLNSSLPYSPYQGYF